SPDAFAGEDRARVMERLGTVYRQAILGIADLMGERTALKNDFRMVRTTIRPQNNNPFKWAPPQRIAIELLRTDDGSGYSTGEAALNEALHDVKAHMLCVLAGMRGAIGATFDLLSPSEIEARTANRGFVMPGQKSAAAWSEYVEQFATQRREADDSAEGPINRAFRQSYEDQARALDGR
ncbi:MAG: type VI secretion system-associated FHA domain protein TagH, partial [Sphingomonas sp.]